MPLSHTPAYKREAKLLLKQRKEAGLPTNRSKKWGKTIRDCINNQNTRIDGMAARIDAHATRIDGMAARIDAHATRIDGMAGPHR